jgi:DNA-damage-inducible protein D
MNKEMERYTSTFEQLRRTEEDGREFWWGRDLQTAMTYNQWRDFNNAINRAMTSLMIWGQTQPHFDMREHIASVQRRPEVSAGGPAKTPSDLGGRPFLDFKLSRRACYTIAMTGDVRKPAIAAAQQYFVDQTEFAEKVQEAIVQQTFKVPRTLQEALRAYADEVDAREKAELLAAEAKAEADMLRPPAVAWQNLVDTGQDYSMAEAAAILNRDPAIETGQNRLRDWMLRNRVLYRRGRGQLVPYSEHLPHIRLKPQSRPDYSADDSRIRKEASSQVRITVKGLEWIQQQMREQTKPELLAVPAPRVEPEVEPPVDFDRFRMDKLRALRR